MLKFDPDGNLVKSFGEGLFARPHGFHIDQDGFLNVFAGEVAGRMLKKFARAN